jgi:predicted NAD/FAD-binding protein
VEGVSSGGANWARLKEAAQSIANRVKVRRAVRLIQRLREGIRNYELRTLEFEMIT